MNFRNLLINALALFFTIAQPFAKQVLTHRINSTYTIAPILIENTITLLLSIFLLFAIIFFFSRRPRSRKTQIEYAVFMLLHATWAILQFKLTLSLPSLPISFCVTYALLFLTGIIRK